MEDELGHRSTAQRREVLVSRICGELYVALTQIMHGHRDGFPHLRSLDGCQLNEVVDLVMELVASFDGRTIRRDEHIKQTLRLYDDDGNQIPGEHPPEAMDPEPST